MRKPKEELDMSFFRKRQRVCIEAAPYSFVACIALPMLLAACKSETAGEMIKFDTGVIGTTSTAEPVATFANARGWNIALTEARVALGPVYFYGAEPQATLFDRLLGIRVAHACPAHAQYDRGAVLGELLQQHVIDLLSQQEQSTGVVAGEAGTCRMIELHLHPPGQVPPGSPTNAFSALNGHTAWIAGTATKESATIQFQGGMTIPDQGTMQIVENIGAQIDLTGASNQSGRVVIQVLLDKWFANVDFSTLPENTEGGPRQFALDSQAYVAWLAGIRSRYSYALTWRNP